MKWKQFAVAGVALLALVATHLGCNQSSNRDTHGPEASGSKAGEALLTGCYIATAGRDTFQLAITQVSDSLIEGSLHYNFFEKDDSDGQVEGIYKDGVLSAIYTFKSEGKLSKRQVIFRKVPTGFIEGFGESKVQDSVDVFVKPESIEFDKKMLFKRTPHC